MLLLCDNIAKLKVDSEVNRIYLQAGKQWVQTILQRHHSHAEKRYNWSLLRVNIKSLVLVLARSYFILFFIIKKIILVLFCFIFYYKKDHICGSARTLFISQQITLLSGWLLERGSRFKSKAPGVEPTT